MRLVNLEPGLGENFTIAVFEKNVHILYVIEIKCYFRLLVFMKPSAFTVWTADRDFLRP